MNSRRSPLVRSEAEAIFVRMEIAKFAEMKAKRAKRVGKKKQKEGKQYKYVVNASKIKSKKKQAKQWISEKMKAQ
jgi:hypothetical protein